MSSGCQLSVHLAGTFKPARASINRKAFRGKNGGPPLQTLYVRGYEGPGGSCFKVELCHGCFSSGMDEKVFFFLKKKIIFFQEKILRLVITSILNIVKNKPGNWAEGFSFSFFFFYTREIKTDSVVLD